MSESEDDSSKTEEPSAKKLEEARKKGQIAASRELNHFFMMLSFLFFVMFLGPKLGGDSLELLTPFVGSGDQFDMSAGGVNDTFQHIVFAMLMLLFLTFLLTVVAAIYPGCFYRKN